MVSLPRTKRPGRACSEVLATGPPPPPPLGGSPAADGWGKVAAIHATPAAMAAASFLPTGLAPCFPSKSRANPRWFSSKQPTPRSLVRPCPMTVRGTSGIVPRGDAVSFLFCAQGLSAALSPPQGDGEDEDEEGGSVRRPRVASAALALHRQRGFPAMRLPPFELASAVALTLPSALAAHSAVSPTGVALACIPMPMLFSVPQASPDAWLANKRALAFHRCCVVGVYVQGAMTFIKFLGGDLIGGAYLGIQTAIGAYATQPDGARLFPSYIMMCGFNGILGLLQVFQVFQGTPLRFLPAFVVLPPVISLTAAYWGWQFCRELRAIAAGRPNDGPVDSCWVRLAGGDWWPASESFGGWGEGSIAGAGGDGSSGPGAGGRGGSGQFHAYAGSGQRLGDS